RTVAFGSTGAPRRLQPCGAPKSWETYGSAPEEAPRMTAFAGYGAPRKAWRRGKLRPARRTRMIFRSRSVAIASISLSLFFGASLRAQDDAKKPAERKGPPPRE